MPGSLLDLAKTTIATAEYADEVLTMSKTTGLATDTLQEFMYASDFIDVSVDTMTSSMSKMIRSMDSARDGSREAAQAFSKLHVSWRDGTGQLKNSEQMFYEVIDALGAMKNETERDAIAMQIFGKSARELNPLIEAGSKELKRLGEEAHTVGAVMGDDTLDKFNNLKDAMDKFSKQTEALKNKMELVLLTIMT